MFEMQVNVIGRGTDTATFADFDGHGTRDHVARGQILGVRCVTLHEALALGVGQIAAFAAHAFGNQAARAVDAGRMELSEFHVLQRQAGAQHHAVAVTGAGVGRGAGKIAAAIAAGGEHHLMGTEQMQAAVGQIPGQHAPAHALVIHHQIDGEVFDEEFGLMLQRLLIKRVQDGVTGAIGRRASALRNAFTEVGGHATEGALINLAGFGARKGHTIVFEFDDRRYRLTTHVFNRILVAEPVGALDGVVHMPAPVVRAHIAERRAHAALRRDRVAARREDLGQTGGRESRFGHAKGGAQARAAGADHDHVVLVFDKWICSRHGVFRQVIANEILSTATMPSSAPSTQPSFIVISNPILAISAWT